MKKKKNRLIILSIIIVVIMIVLGMIIFKLENHDIKKSTEKHEIIKKERPKKIQIIDLNSKTRPIAVMINNVDTVWGYQSGLQDAYLVYEIIVEGGYTRLMALFKDKSIDRIGTVRSARHYFLDYALENDAIYVHFGWSPQAQSDISLLGVNNINFMTFDEGYIRDYSINLASEHTVFTSTNQIINGIEKYGYNKESNQSNLLNYSADEVDLSKLDGNSIANKVIIPYSYLKSTSYEYDNFNKVYKRFQNDIEHIDYVTKQQYTVKNIIVYQVNNHLISNDDKGRQTIDNIGSGDGFYISNGYSIPITWEKNARESKTVYRYLNGQEIKVNDGNTYIQIMPSDQNLSIS